VLKAANMKMTFFWVVGPSSLVEVYRRFRGSDDGGSNSLWNVGKILPDYTTSQKTVIFFAAKKT
jgi:hypothetical protein